MTLPGYCLREQQELASSGKALKSAELTTIE